MGFFKKEERQALEEPRVSTLFEAIKDGTFRNPYLMPDKYEPEHAKRKSGDQTSSTGTGDSSSRPRGKHKKDK